MTYYVYFTLSYICSYAGIHCKIINGHAKGADYTPGQRFTSLQEGHHSWNAVLVDNTWCLIDCHWASRRLVGKELDNIRYKLDEYYFMPDPRELVYTHLPDDDKWPLLVTPLSKSEFEDLALVKSTFFKLGLQLISHKQALINLDNEVTLEIASTEKTEFTFAVVDDKGHDENNRNYGNVA